MAERPKKKPRTSPATCPLPKLLEFIGKRVVLHKDSGTKLIGTLTEITSTKKLIITDAYKERVDGTTTHLGTIKIPHMEVIFVCRHSKCQIGQSPVPEGAEPQHTPMQAEGVAGALETDSSKPVKTQGKSPEIHMGESSKLN